MLIPLDLLKNGRTASSNVFEFVTPFASGAKEKDTQAIDA